jgi:hypothetical protein
MPEPEVRIVGDAIEVDGVVVARIVEATATTRREALEDVIRDGTAGVRLVECEVCGRDRVPGGVG